MDQTERAYQRQKQVSMGPKNKGRFYKNVGLGIATPKAAIKGTYVDKKCPFTSDVTIRGRMLTGIVRSAKMQRTIIIRRDYLHYVPKYSRYEKRHKTVAAHCSPAFGRVKEGDQVVIGECRPLSKTVHFNVIKVEKAGKKAKKVFRKF